MKAADLIAQAQITIKGLIPADTTFECKAKNQIRSCTVLCVDAATAKLVFASIKFSEIIWTEPDAPDGDEPATGKLRFKHDQTIKERRAGTAHSVLWKLVYEAAPQKGFKFAPGQFIVDKHLWRSLIQNRLRIVTLFTIGEI